MYGECSGAQLKEAKEGGVLTLKRKRKGKKGKRKRQRHWQMERKRLEEEGEDGGAVLGVLVSEVVFVPAVVVVGPRR